MQPSLFKAAEESSSWKINIYMYGRECRILRMLSKHYYALLTFGEDEFLVAGGEPELGDVALVARGLR